MEENIVYIKAWLHKQYSSSVPIESNRGRGFSNFKRGCTNIDDSERSGCPIKVVTSGNIRKVHIIVLENRKMKLNERADTL